MRTMTMKSHGHKGATPSAGAQLLSATEHTRAANAAVTSGAPEQRPRRAAAAAANEAMDELEQRGELV